MCNISDITRLLSLFPSITLEEMSAIRLMNRIDTKFVVNLPTLYEILSRARNDYRVQEIGGERNLEYQTVYLDTPECAMYLAHHSGKTMREKIRVRTYMASGVSYLEVKNKNNHGRTDKKRIPVNDVTTLYDDGGEEFLHANAWYELSYLHPSLENKFNRITLVNNELTERLTIDTDVFFRHPTTGTGASLCNLAVIELKRACRSHSPMTEILRELHVHPSGFSKYCIGTALTSESVKHNRFKQKMRFVSKISSPHDSVDTYI